MRAVVASAHCALTCALVANGIALSLTPAVAACQYANAVALAAQFYWSWDAMFVVRAVVSAVRAVVLVRAASCGRLRACDPRPWSGDDVRLPLRAVHALAAVRMVANGYSLLAQYAEAALMWWFAFRGPRRVNFFGGAADLECAEARALAAETDKDAETDAETSIASACEPASYAFDRKLAWKFFREATSMLGRVANVVAVWAGTSALAARIGVYSGAAHVLLFQIICIISIAAGALTTVSNAVASRLQVAEGDSAASGAGAALSLLGVAIFFVIGNLFWAIRVPLLTNFTPDTRVVEAALRSYPVVMMCVSTYFYKALEGALIGRGDAKSVNAVFAAGGFVCAASLAWTCSKGALTLQGVWHSLLLYYVALSGGMLIRWIQLDRGVAPIGGKTFKTTPAAPIASADDGDLSDDD